MANEIPKDIIEALKVAFKADSEADSLARVIYFLAKRINDHLEEPFIQSFRAVITIPAVFKKIAERMVADTKELDENPHYLQMMHEVWDTSLKEAINPGDCGQRLDIALLPEVAITQYVFMRAVSCLQHCQFVALKDVVSRYAGSAAVYGTLAVAHKAGPVVRIKLVTLFLAIEVIKNIKRWWNGEISGKRCLKNVMDCGVGVAAGLVGGYYGELAGAALLAPFGPVGVAVGAIAGAVCGGVAASLSAEKLSDRLSRWVFGLPKSEALEKAYSFINVASNSSNSDINSRYRQLALQYHPDKGGDRDKWTQLQYYMAVIREARGES